MRKVGFFKQRLLAFKYSIAGIKHLVSTETHAQLQIIIGLGVVAAGFYFDISRVEWMVQLLSIALVLATETLNTAIEKLADFVHPEFHDKIGRIKDVSAGAVTISAMIAFIIGIMIYWPYLSELLS